MKYLGCAYYPEYWGVERVSTDAALMQEAGVNLVRIGEFAWCRMEPEENSYKLDWLHRTIDIMGRHGIDVLMCTPTATPPAWLTSRYPETLLTKADGGRLEHGGRRHYCYTSETYRRHTGRIVEKLASEFSPYQNVVAWQIDNEPDFCEGGICGCESCQRRFREWLKEKYGRIEELNRRWATGFWSMDYTDWEQVRLGRSGHYSSRLLDTRRFASAMLSDFILQQAAIIKKLHPAAMVTTNLNGGIFTELDFHRMYSTLDVAAKDLYFDICTMDRNALIMNQFRSFKPGKKYWVTETGAGMCGIGRPPHKGQFGAWMWSNFAHGGDAHVVFRWRTCLSGQEQELEGMLEHSGHPGHRYRAVKAAFREMREIGARLGDIPLPKADVALVHDYETMWGYYSSGVGGEINYEKIFCALHRELYRRNVLADVVPPDGDLSRYKLIILPSLMMINEAFAGHVKDYLTRGGVVLAQGQLGMRDFNDNYLGARGPAHLQDVFGVLINGGMYLHSCVGPDEGWGQKNYFTTKLSGTIGKRKVRGCASRWLADLELNGGHVLLSVAEDTYAGQPAMVEKKYGEGTALYCAASEVDEQLSGQIFDYALAKAGIRCVKNVPEHVEIIRRGGVVFVINHRSEKVSVDLGMTGEVLRGTLKKGVAALKPFEVLIARADPSPIRQGIGGRRTR